MNDKEISEKCFQMYQMSLKNLQEGNPDLVDEVIVYLWRTLEGLVLEKRILQELICSQQKDLTELTHKLEIHMTRNMKEVYGEVNMLDVLKPYMKGTA